MSSCDPGLYSMGDSSIILPVNSPFCFRYFPKLSLSSLQSILLTNTQPQYGFISHLPSCLYIGYEEKKMAVLLGGASHYTFPDLQPQVNLQYYVFHLSWAREYLLLQQENKKAPNGNPFNIPNSLPWLPVCQHDYSYLLASIFPWGSPLCNAQQRGAWISSTAPQGPGSIFHLPLLLVLWFQSPSLVWNTYTPAYKHVKCCL